MILEEGIFLYLLIECLLSTLLRSGNKAVSRTNKFPHLTEITVQWERWTVSLMHVKCQGSLSYVKKDKTKQRKQRRGYSLRCGGQGKHSSDVLLREKTPQNELIKTIALLSLKFQYCLGSSRWLCSSQISTGLQGPAA